MIYIVRIGASDREVLRVGTRTPRMVPLLLDCRVRA